MLKIVVFLKGRGIVPLMAKGQTIIRFWVGILVFMVMLPFAHAGESAPEEQGNDSSAAVVFSWHRIGEEDGSGTSLRPENFEAQIDELIRGDYTLVSLSEIVSAMRNRHPLPPLSVALTFDGGHAGTLEKAEPILTRNHIPFAVFFATDKADENAPGYLGWDEIRALARNPLVTLGIHSAAYVRLTDAQPAEIARQINKARARYREELGAEPAFFAYPFGATSSAYRAIIEKQNFRAAFGQQSGVASPMADPYLIPRFPVTEGYGDIDRFLMTARALPLPARNIAPEDPLLSENPPAIGFSIESAPEESLEGLSCFSSGQGRPSVEKIGNDRVELRFDHPFDDPRVRINCTLPANALGPDGETRWRWLGFLLTVPERLIP